MSVASFTNIRCNIYSVTNGKDSYGADTKTYTLKYGYIPTRIRYLSGRENIYNGKEANYPTYRLYFSKQFNIIPSDLIVDVKNRRWDILFVNKLIRTRHMQIDCKQISKIEGDTCPNIINSFNASIVTLPAGLSSYGYLTVESNGSNTKNHFIQVFNASTTGYTASDKIFYGDYNSGGISVPPSDSYQSIMINGTEYYIHIYTGIATSSCCTDVVGVNMANG